MTARRAPFDERTYLSLNPDVRDAVNAGTYRSGWEHYQKFGASEGRPTGAAMQTSHFVRDYTSLVQTLIEEHADDRPLAMAKAIGSRSVEDYRNQGDYQVQVLLQLGLKPGQRVYDLGCGSGRTASALLRSGWDGQYVGVDVVPELIEFASGNCPGWQFEVHRKLSIYAEPASLDMVWAWSVFTHLTLEEILVYLEDIQTCLAPGGTLVFSFLELRMPEHLRLLRLRSARLLAGIRENHLDTFLAREQIRDLAEAVGLQPTRYVDSDDSGLVPGKDAFGQSIAVLTKATT